MILTTILSTVLGLFQHDSRCPSNESLGPTETADPAVRFQIHRLFEAAVLISDKPSHLSTRKIPDYHLIMTGGLRRGAHRIVQGRRSCQDLRALAARLYFITFVQTKTSSFPTLLLSSHTPRSQRYNTFPNLVPGQTCWLTCNIDLHHASLIRYRW